jgi:predicted ATPase
MTDVGAVLVAAEGDLLFFACAEAGAAIDGMMAAKTALASHPWPEGLPFRVRAGVHTGPSQPVGHSYFTLAVHQAARISAAGHGGQILASAATAGLVSRAHRSLGRYHLKDFDEPVEIVQFDDDEHPPLKVMPESVRQLALPNTSFVGRDGELARLRELFAAHRLVTICGAGGVGKTRLAVEYAAEAPADVQVAVAELAGARNRSEVESAIAAALDVEQEAGRTVLDVVLASLRSRPAGLLVLDNCEHLIEDVADLAELLMREIRQVRLLLSSREPMDLPDEAVFRLSPLDVPSSTDQPLEEVVAAPATRLLLDRVLVRAPELVPKRTDAAHLASICQRLEGSPLALELVAAHIAAVGFADARLSIDDGWHPEGGRGRPERHRSIDAALDWSYTLLSPDERSLWERLAVFVAPFRSADAVDVAADGELTAAAVRTGLVALVNKSIVNRVNALDGARYRMHQSVREFGLQRLRDSAALEPTEDRHAEWALRFMEQNWWSGPPPADWYAAYRVCRDDIVAAWRRHRHASRIEAECRLGLISAYWDCFVAGRFGEGHQLLQRLVALPQNSATSSVLIALAEAEAFQGNPDTARRLIDQARLTADAHELGWIHGVDASRARASGDLARAKEISLESLRSAPTYWREHIAAETHLALIAFDADDHDGVLAHATAALERARTLDDDAYVLIVSLTLAVERALAGDRDGAVAAAQAQLEYAAARAVEPVGTWVRLCAAVWGGAGKPEVLSALHELVVFEPNPSTEDAQALFILRTAGLWRALAVAVGVFESLAAAFTFGVPPRYRRFLDESLAALAEHLDAATVAELRDRGRADPSMAAIVAAAEDDLAN